MYATRIKSAAKIYRLNRWIDASRRRRCQKRADWIESLVDCSDYRGWLMQRLRRLEDEARRNGVTFAEVAE
jgi:hypothetical protein